GGGQGLGAQSPGRLEVQLLGGGSLGSPCDGGRALGLGDQCAQPDQHVLVSGQLGCATTFEQFRQRVVGKGDDVRTHCRTLGVQCLQFARPGVVEVAA